MDAVLAVAIYGLLLSGFCWMLGAMIAYRVHKTCVQLGIDLQNDKPRKERVRIARNTRLNMGLWFSTLPTLVVFYFGPASLTWLALSTLLFTGLIDLAVFKFKQDYGCKLSERLFKASKTLNWLGQILANAITWLHKRTTARELAMQDSERRETFMNPNTNGDQSMKAGTIELVALMSDNERKQLAELTSKCKAASETLEEASALLEAKESLTERQRVHVTGLQSCDLPAALNEQLDEFMAVQASVLNLARRNLRATSYEGQQHLQELRTLLERKRESPEVVVERLRNSIAQAKEKCR